MSRLLPGVSFSAWKGDEFVPVVEVLLALGPWILDAQWRLLGGEFAPGWRGSDELTAMSGELTLVSTTALIDLVSDGVQMIGGRLEATRAGLAEPFLVVESVRGDGWDVRTTASGALDAVRRVFEGVVELE